MMYLSSSWVSSGCDVCGYERGICEVEEGCVSCRVLWWMMGVRSGGAGDASLPHV